MQDTPRDEMLLGGKRKKGKAVVISESGDSEDSDDEGIDNDEGNES